MSGSAVERTVGRVLLGTRRGAAPSELAVVQLRAARPGPVAVVTANLHGDEVTGVRAAHGLDAWLAEHLRCGSVVLYPSCNPTGLEAGSRVVPVDDTDLNRVFPGAARGSASLRGAAALWKDLVGHKPDVVIDLHADAPVSIPYAILDRPARLSAHARQRLGAELERLGAATGLTVLREYVDEHYLNFGLDRSLAGAVVNLLGVPALTLEVGPRRWLHHGAVATMERAVTGVLAALGMVEERVAPHPTRVEGCWRRMSAPRTRRAGILETVLSPGERFERGALLGRVRSVLGEVEDQVLAVDPGVVVSYVEGAWLASGAVVGTLGVPDEGQL